MRASRAILACASFAIGILIASAWIASSRYHGVDPLAPVVGEEMVAQHRASIALDPASASTAPASSSTREVPPPPGIRGRLIEAGTGAPLAGWTIRLEHHAEPTPFAYTRFAPGMHRYSAAVIELPNIQVLRADGATPAIIDRPEPEGIDHSEPSKDASAQRLLSYQAADARGNSGAVASTPEVTQQLLTAITSAQSDLERGAQTAADTSSSAATPPIETNAASAPELPTPAQRVLTLRFLSHGIAPRPAAEPGEANPAAIPQQPQLSVPVDEMRALILARVMQSQLTTNLETVQTLRMQLDSDVEIVRPNCTQAECVTDADGRFELPCPDHDDAWLTLEPRPPLHPDSTRYDLHKSADACARFIEWKTHLTERAVLHARVVDAATGEPVPYLEVVVSSADRSETLVSDAQGKFASTKPLPTGRVRVAFRDGPEEQTSAHELGRSRIVDVPCEEPAAVLDTSGKELVFRVAIGPTYRFTLPNGLEPDLVVARLHGIAARNAHDADALDGDWHPMRNEGEWFVRVPVRVRAAPGAVPALDVWTDGMHRAHVELQRFEGRGERGEMPLALGARLHGHVVGDDGSEIAGARLALIGRDGSELDATTSEADGTWQFVGVDAGTFSRVQVTLGSASQSASAPLQAGEDRELDLTPGTQPR